ncbi:hypothetical protein LCGC14_1355190 [marine sediment metagenome]|uniref:Uncharacterized protein n=1 Tax=marine sediment metagenome TaxID=412755 RepID=A0A0F9MQ33_9ZZZZ|nr:hypothetical protein [Candidatus Aminicenantes bacterium]
MSEDKTTEEESTNSLPEGGASIPDNEHKEEGPGQDILKEVTPGSPGQMGIEVPAQGKILFNNLKDILDDAMKEADTMGAGLRSLLEAPILENPTNNATITKVRSDILTAASNIGLAGGLIDNAIGQIQRELEPAGTETKE